jgi:cysteine synthase
MIYNNILETIGKTPLVKINKLAGENDAICTSRRLAKEEGILAGISAGANVWAAVQIAKEAGKGKVVLVMVPDLGERYLSTDLFKEENNLW